MRNGRTQTRTQQTPQMPPRRSRQPTTGTSSLARPHRCRARLSRETARTRLLRWARFRASSAIAWRSASGARGHLHGHTAMPKLPLSVKREPTADDQHCVLQAARFCFRGCRTSERRSCIEKQTSKDLAHHDAMRFHQCAKYKKKAKGLDRSTRIEQGARQAAPRT